jgi:hypothetical protein
MPEFLQHAFHWDELVAGALFWGIVGHAVNTFPRPENRFALWLLGVAQFVVGQRQQAAETREKLNGTGKFKAKDL